jgi:hypothetical protein
MPTMKCHAEGDQKLEEQNGSEIIFRQQQQKFGDGEKSNGEDSDVEADDDNDDNDDVDLIEGRKDRMVFSSDSMVENDDIGTVTVDPVVTETPSSGHNGGSGSSSNLRRSKRDTNVRLYVDNSRRYYGSRST